MAEDKAKNRGKPKSELNDKQKIFCEEYAKHGNGTLAYKTAYPTTKKDETAKANASRMLTKDNVKKYIKDLSNIATDNRIADMREIKEFWSNMLRNTESKDSDRLKASELLGKTYGAFLDRVENTTPTTIHFVMNKVSKK